jgi:hypothetical protein
MHHTGNGYRNDTDAQALLTLLCLLAILAAVVLTIYQLTQQPVAALPPTPEEKQNAFHHVLQTVSSEEMRLYNYYAERSRP